MKKLLLGIGLMVFTLSIGMTQIVNAQSLPSNITLIPSTTPVANVPPLSVPQANQLCTYSLGRGGFGNYVGPHPLQYISGVVFQDGSTMPVGSGYGSWNKSRTTPYNALANRSNGVNLANKWYTYMDTTYADATYKVILTGFDAYSGVILHTEGYSACTDGSQNCAAAPGQPSPMTDYPATDIFVPFSKTCDTGSNNRAIGGRYYFDNNSSKSFDTGDIGLSGKNMYLYQYNPNALVPISPLQLIKTVVTDNFGKYIFTGLSNTGQYQVRFDIMSGFDFTNIYIADFGRIITLNEVLGYYNSAYGIMQPEAGDFDNIDAGIIVSNIGTNCEAPRFFPRYQKWDTNTCNFVSCGGNGQAACDRNGLECRDGLTNIGGICRPYPNTNYCVNYYNDLYVNDFIMQGASHEYIINKINLSNGSTIILSGTDLVRYSGDIIGSEFKNHIQGLRPSIGLINHFANPKYSTSNGGIYTTGSTGDTYIQSVEYSGYMTDGTMTGVVIGDIMHQELYIKQYTGSATFTTTCYTGSTSTGNTNTGVNCIVPDIIPAYKQWNSSTCALESCGKEGQKVCNDIGFTCDVGLQNIGGTCKPYPNINYCVNYHNSNYTEGAPLPGLSSLVITKINLSNGSSVILSGTDYNIYTGSIYVIHNPTRAVINMTGLLHKYTKNIYQRSLFPMSYNSDLTAVGGEGSGPTNRNGIYTTGSTGDIYITSIEYTGSIRSMYSETGDITLQSGTLNFITTCYTGNTNTGVINTGVNTITHTNGGGGYTPQPLAVNHNIIPAGTGIVNTLYGNVQTTTTNSGTTIKLLDLRNYINRSEPSTNEFPNIEVIKDKGILEIVKVGADIDLAYELAIETLNLVK